MQQPQEQSVVLNPSQLSQFIQAYGQGQTQLGQGLSQGASQFKGEQLATGKQVLAKVKSNPVLIISYIIIVLAALYQIISTGLILKYNCNTDGIQKNLFATSFGLGFAVGMLLYGAMVLNPTIAILIFSFAMLIVFATNAGIMDKDIEGKKVYLIRMNVALIGLTSGLLLTSIFTLISFYQSQNIKVGLVVASIMALIICLSGLVFGSFGLDAWMKCKKDPESSSRKNTILKGISGTTIGLSGFFLIIAIILIVVAVRYAPAKGMGAAIGGAPFLAP